MARRISRYEEWCPECGHLLPKNNWDCDFCGWSGSSSRLGASLACAGVESDVGALEIAGYTDDVDQFIDQLHADESVASSED